MLYVCYFISVVFSLHVLLFLLVSIFPLFSLPLCVSSVSLVWTFLCVLLLYLVSASPLVSHVVFLLLLRLFHVLPLKLVPVFLVSSSLCAIGPDWCSTFLCIMPEIYRIYPCLSFYSYATRPVCLFLFPMLLITTSLILLLLLLFCSSCSLPSLPFFSSMSVLSNPSYGPVILKRKNPKIVVPGRSENSCSSCVFGRKY